MAENSSTTSRQVVHFKFIFRNLFCGFCCTYFKLDKDFFRPVYNFDDLVEGKPRVCPIR